MTDDSSGERRAITILRVSGGAVLLLSIVMLAIFPAAPVERNVPGFVSPVVGFELASEPAHVFGILGQPDAPARAAAVRGMNLGNRIDFLFMVAYPALYVGIVLLLRARGRLTAGRARFVLVLPVVMWLGDLLENRELLALAELTDPAAMTSGLARLRPFTIMKWYALFGTSALLAYPIWQDRSWWRWSGVLFGVAAAVGFTSVAYLPAIETAGYLLALAWLTTWVYSLRA
jgi:hypothetical protein